MCTGALKRVLSNSTCPRSANDGGAWEQLAATMRLSAGRASHMSLLLDMPPMPPVIRFCMRCIDETFCILAKSATEPLRAMIFCP